jgi:DNA mismatch repair protein MutL
MSKIKLLSKELINQIAAGEVVERPASVVKELVENSLDAGADKITIEVENGGMNLIRVTDNGSGMNREDAEKSTMQHATSKLEDDSDLFQIKTLGFRGEALASISSVSQFSVLTKNEDSLAGTLVEIKDGEFKVEEAGSAVGTCVTVEQLFYNVPARQKYLKTTVTEFNHVVDLFLSYCLAYPDIAWKLMHNNKPVYQFPAVEAQQRISDALGEDVMKSLIPIDMKLNEIRVQGFVGKPQIARNNRKLQYLFVNKRPVNEFIIAKNVKDAFTTLIPRELFPVYILNMEINNEKVDVNVHPRKLEVRFSEPQIVYRTMYQIISKTLDEHDLVKSMPSEELKKFTPISQVLENKQTGFGSAFKGQVREITTPPFDRLKRTRESGVVGFNQTISQTQAAAEPFDSKAEAGIKILAQVQNSYIIVETEKGIKIYDQHASSERVQYEKIKKQWQIGQLASQKMLIPQNIELAPAESRAVSENVELFLRLGFGVSGFGGNSFAVSAVPRFLAQHDIKKVILEIASDLDSEVEVADKISEPIDRILKMMSCKSAIKFGDQLSEQGMIALIKDLEELGNQYTCVHGRPCVVEFSFVELEKMFKRS